MKVVTLGLSPFVLTSRGKIHSWLLKLFYLTGHKTAGLVWGHHKDYFIPQEDGRYYFDFEFNGESHNIPIEPFERGEKESVQVYDVLMDYDPDIVVSIGDISDFTYMHAIKSLYSKNIKWMNVLLNYNWPINESLADVVRDMDGVLCTSKFALDHISKFYQGKLKDYQFAGCNPKLYYLRDRQNDSKFRVLGCPKGHQSDCAPTIMQASAEIRTIIPNLELYLHSNVHDPGDHDLLLLKERFDPGDHFIRFGDKYVSLIDGINDDDMSILLNSADVFVSVPMICASSMSVMSALACGCYPVLSDVGTNRNIVEELCKYLNGGFSPDDFLVRSIEVMGVGETYLSVCDRSELAKKIVKAHETLKKFEGLRKRFSQFTRNFSQSAFLEKVLNMATSVLESQQTLHLESI